MKLFDFKKKTIFAFAMLIIATLSLTGCGQEENVEDIATEATKEASVMELVLENYASTKAKEAKEINEDVIGWLTIPGTEIDEPVLYSFDNRNYNNSDLYGAKNIVGSYFVDMDCVGTKGESRDSLDKQTVIYGRNFYDTMDRTNYYLKIDAPEELIERLRSDKYDDENGIKFAQLFKFRDKDFAEKHPYVIFSSDKEERAWEIFAVYYDNVTTGFIRWNAYETMATEDGMMNVVKNSRERSLFDYDVKVNKDDKLLTLSTSSYCAGANCHDIRFSVCCRLVEDGSKLKNEINLKENEDKVPYYKEVELKFVNKMDRQ